MRSVQRAQAKVRGSHNAHMHSPLCMDAMLRGALCVPRRRFDFRHDERLRNAAVVGLPPPTYPIAGLERHSGPGSSAPHTPFMTPLNGQNVIAHTDTSLERAWRSSIPSHDKGELSELGQRTHRGRRRGTSPRVPAFLSNWPQVKDGKAGGTSRSMACAIM